MVAIRSNKLRYIIKVICILLQLVLLETQLRGEVFLCQFVWYWSDGYDVH